MAFLFLDDNEAESLLVAAREGQAAKLELIENIEESDDYDVTDLRHFQAEHARTARLIDEIEKRLTFSLVDAPSVPKFGV
tara:strand:- start:901 stop:1140 length:240 start_codon:yes stop_codon:yes gene_type:complete